MSRFKPSRSLRKTLGTTLFLAVSVAVGGYYWLANKNKAELDERWASSDESSEQAIDHSEWQTVLDDYLVTDDESGVHLFDYEGLLDDGREPLDGYVDNLLEVNPLALNSVEQMAYWINLYNALTVQLIIDHYPLQSITTLGETIGSFGPWDDALASVNGHELSLNDIEHRIIRPLYGDHRIHFAVNCASIGCPDLAADAYTSENLDTQLTQAAEQYLQHDRGLNIDGDTLHLSTIFKWYAEDFGDDLATQLTTLAQYALPEAGTWLQSFNGEPVYDYDWSLNGLCYSDQSCDAS